MTRTDFTDDDLRRAEQNALDTMHAQVLRLSIQAAARTHPEELRAALASVFDTAAIEDLAKRHMVAMSQAQAYANEVRDLYLAVNKDLDAIEERIGRVWYELDLIERTHKRLAARVAQPT